MTLAQRWIWGIAWFGASAVAAACGGEVTVGGPGAGGSAFWPSYCSARAAACGIMEDACLPEETCARALLRDEVEDALFQCLATTCAEDTCVAQIREQFPLSEKGAAFDAACESYLDACPGGNDDVCQATPILADGLLEQLLACTSASASCDEITACLGEVGDTTADLCDDWISSP
jgi:hypothetical protein